MFVNKDEFGIKDFRESFNYIYEANTVFVKRIKRSEYNIKTQPGDFLGIKTKPAEDEEDIIEINIMSQEPNLKKMEIEGYNDFGAVIYKACCSYSIEIHHMDTIEFLKDDNPNSINKGSRFRIIMEDEGLYQGQYCFKFFKMVKI